MTARLPPPPPPSLRRLQRAAWSLLAVGLVAIVLTAAGRLLAARHDLLGARADLLAARADVVAQRQPSALEALDRAGRRISSARRRVARFPVSSLGSVPLAGSPVKAVEAGARAAAHAMAAGRELATAPSPLQVSSSGGAGAYDLGRLHDVAGAWRQHLDRATAELSAARQQLGGPGRAALPQVSGPARSMQRAIDDSIRQAGAARQVVELIAAVTERAGDRRYLLLSQDSLELRPTGGFIGSYGLLRISGGVLSLDQYADTLGLPLPVPAVPAPADLARALPRPWNLSNANWWPDFPTSARTAQGLFRRQGGGEVDGVIAITDNLLARLVAVYGPLALPGYPQPVTGTGLAQRIVDEVELKSPPDRPRKRFLDVLARTVLDRLAHTGPDRTPALSRALADSVATGSVQVWFSDAALEARISAMAVAGRLPAVSDGDFLMVVGANMTASKSNLGLMQHVLYQVRRRAGGSLSARVIINARDNQPPGPINPLYNGYYRLYVPPDAVLDRGQPRVRDLGPAPDGPYRVFAQDVQVAVLADRTFSFSYRLPARVAPSGHYRLTWLRQVGSDRDVLTAEVAGRRARVPTGQRLLHVRAQVGGSRLARWLRHRWLIRKLTGAS